MRVQRGGTAALRGLCLWGYLLACGQGSSGSPLAFWGQTGFFTARLCSVSETGVMGGPASVPRASSSSATAALCGDRPWARPWAPARLGCRAQPCTLPARCRPLSEVRPGPVSQQQLRAAPPHNPVPSALQPWEGGGCPAVPQCSGPPPAPAAFQPTPLPFPGHPLAAF